MRHALGRTTAAVAIVALLAACGSDDTSSTEPAGSTPRASQPSTSAATSGGEARLVVANFSFSEVDGAVAGSPIAVQNEDAFAHTVTADEGAFDAKLSAKGTATITVEQPGTYTFHCEIHPSMKGTLTVG